MESEFEAAKLLNKNNNNNTKSIEVTLDNTTLILNFNF